MRRLPAGPAANEASTLGSAPRCPDLWREAGRTAARVSPLPSGPAARPLSRVVTCSTVSVPKNTVSAHGFGWGVRDGHEQRWRPAVTAATSRPMRTTGGARRAGDCRRGCLPGRSGRRLGRRASWPTQSMNLGRGIEGTCGGDRSFSSLFFFLFPLSRQTARDEPMPRVAANWPARPTAPSSLQPTLGYGRRRCRAWPSASCLVAAAAVADAAAGAVCSAGAVQAGRLRLARVGCTDVRGCFLALCISLTPFFSWEAPHNLIRCALLSS